MPLWDDGRSGAAGCTAGSFALDAFAAEDPILRKIKGTVFESAKAIIIGRVCASDAYLEDPVLHWANASWDQHEELERSAKGAGKSLAYLFVTASSDPPTVRYWRVPAKVVEAVFIERGRARAGGTCAIHVTTSNGKQWIGRTDVSKCCTRIELDPVKQTQLKQAFDAPKRPQSRGGSSGEARERSVAGVASFDIPAAGAQMIRVQMRLPLAPADVARLKQWVDLMADVLTEDYQPEVRRIGPSVHDQIQEGLDALDRGDTVDGEQAIDRILRRRRQHRQSRAKAS